jgi:hypothetical protein
MEKLIWPVVIIVIIAIVSKLLDKKGILKEDNNVYVKKEFLLNIPERQFFEILQRLLPTDYVCYPQILLSNILSVKTAKNEFWKYQNKINRKTVDFVIFKKPYLQPILAIEYDGHTHDRPDRKTRDEFVNDVIHNSNLAIVHIKHGQ